MTELEKEQQALRDKVNEFKRLMRQFEELVNNYEEENHHVDDTSRIH